MPAIVLAPVDGTWPSQEWTGAAVVADILHDDEGSDETMLRGHGVQLRQAALVATVCGLVQRVNKLVTVQAWRHRYRAEVGDVVVGRVAEAAGKRWRVDLAAQVDAALLLSAVNLPGGVQRRRTAEDELNMRLVYQEGDLISAEVQAVHHDGSIMLHARSAKYGRLAHGLAVQVPAALVKRQKRHFVKLPTGTRVVLGCNGVVWVAPDMAALPAAAAAATDEVAATARVAQAIKVLAHMHCAITPASVVSVVHLSHDTPVHQMLTPSFYARIRGLINEADT